MKRTKHIVDTTMRDGEQSPGIVMTKEIKLKIARILDQIGVFQIEAGIPAAGSYEIDTIGEMIQNRNQAKISVWNRLKADDIQKSFECCPDIIHICVPVSYVHIYSKLKKNKAWIIKNMVSCVELAAGRGFEVTVGFEDASRADITFMIHLACLLRDLGVTRIRIADTVGVLTPSATFQSVRDIIENAGVDVEIHTHNDLGMAVANSITGAKAGADYIDTTILGIGERTGNCDFRKFIDAADSLFHFGISKQEALRAQTQIAEILALPPVSADQSSADERNGAYDEETNPYISA